MECLPKRIIIADEELADGVNLGYYPDLRKQLEQNECKILSFDEFKAKKYPILGSIGQIAGYYFHVVVL